MLSLPFLVFATVGILFSAATRAERIIKIAGTALVVALLLAAGFAEFLLGIFEFTATRYFSAEFQNSRMSLYFVSILFQDEAHGAGGPVLAVLGIAGLLHASFFASRRLQWIARSVLTFAALNLIFGRMTVDFDFWYGPSPINLETMVWPFYATFAVHLAVSLVVVCAGRIARRRGTALGANSRGAEPIALAVMAVAPPAIVFALFALIPPVSKRDNYGYPPTRPAIVETLRESVGLTLGGPVRGRVATFALQAEETPAIWFDLHRADNFRGKHAGNDFHMVGLWYFGIPTLIEYAPTLSPPLFRATTRLLARPEDQQLRSVLVLRHIDAKVLAALGVRYIITDVPASRPLHLVETQEIHDTVTLYLYEVPGAIVDVVSPTNYEPARSFDAALERLADPQFDPHATAIVTEADAEAIGFGELVPATSASMRLARGGFGIEAVSQGRSLLVLPFQFSNCLSFTSDRPSNRSVDLFRVNALETGILFDGQLSGELRYFTGPFDGAGCRLRDARDFSRALVE